jgi:predicted AAA+ superfamily ATPase
MNTLGAARRESRLRDRFGLWLGFHACSQDDYLAIVHSYAEHFGLAGAREKIEREALDWALARGSRSGWTAGNISRISPADWARRWGDPVRSIGPDRAPGERPGI